MPAGLPHVALFFGASTASLASGAWWLRAVRGRRVFLGLAAGLLTVLTVHELSFFFRPTREWIRVDLLLTIPLAVVLDLLGALACLRLGIRPSKLVAAALVGCLLLGVSLLLPGLWSP